MSGCEPRLNCLSVPTNVAVSPGLLMMPAFSPGFTVPRSKIIGAPMLSFCAPAHMPALIPSPTLFGEPYCSVTQRSTIGLHARSISALLV